MSKPFSPRPILETSCGPERSPFTDATRLPRVTVVSANPICRDQANGIFMRSLFLGWPQEALSQVYFPVAVTHMPDRAVCGDYRLIHPSGRVQRIAGGNAGPIASPKQDDPGGSGPQWRKTVAGVTRRPRLMRWLRPGVELWYANSWLQAILERQLLELRPNLVYALLGNYCLTKLTYSACKRLGIPLFVHVTDDFVTSLYATMPFSAPFQTASERWFRRAVGHAEGVAAISPVMAEEYDGRYGGPWTWFATLIDADAYDPTPRSTDGTVRLVYAGNLGLERWRSLAELGAALRTLRTENGIDARLTVYSTPDQIAKHQNALASPPAVEIGGWLPPERLPAVFHDADVLVHAESFDPAAADYTRLSFSTKLSQYFMAGRCVLMFGPTDIGSARMIQLAGAGLTLGQTDRDATLGALRRLLVDDASRRRYGDNGRRYALTWFESTAGRERFRLALAEAFEASRRNCGTPVASLLRS
ncbi:MAG: hypothetical protein ABFC63_12100 [Thermoguttaceae bacterium]